MEKTPPLDLYRNWATVEVPDHLVDTYLQMGSKDYPNVPVQMRHWLDHNCKSKWLVQFVDREFIVLSGTTNGYIYKCLMRFRLERDAVLFKLFIC